MAVDETIIETRNLSFKYPDGPRALKDISLKIERGGFLALLGQNGSGKTTLAKHFNGLLSATEGEVIVDGQPAHGRSVGELAKHVGYVFQNPDHQIFSPTTREEIAFGPENLGLDEAEVERRTEQALEYFGLQEYAHHQPAMLSFGIRRKVTIAAVYAMQTPILILDEPTTGLDWRSVEELMQRVIDLHRRGRTILLITHDMNLVAEYAPRCVLLRGGELVADGPTRELFGQAELLRSSDIQAPQITELGRRLEPYGVVSTILTVNEMCSKYEELAARGGVRDASRG